MPLRIVAGCNRTIALIVRRTLVRRCGTGCKTNAVIKARKWCNVVSSAIPPAHDELRRKTDSGYRLIARAAAWCEITDVELRQLV